MWSGGKKSLGSPSLQTLKLIFSFTLSSRIIAIPTETLQNKDPQWIKVKKIVCCGRRQKANKKNCSTYPPFTLIA